jgi:hypothetical protein
VSAGQAKELEGERKDLEEALNEATESTIRQAWLPNTLAWASVATGGFLLNLALLVLLTGG